MRPSRATANRLRLVLSAAAVCAMTLGAAQAAGYSENFGGGYYANGVRHTPRVRTPGTTRRTTASSP